MDEERIGLVLAKTSELRSKIINCIHKASSTVERESRKSESEDSKASPDAENVDYDVEDEAESLLNIKDALESLEGQLSSLQTLQQQQWYEKEAALAEIEHSQKKLLKELKQYKGEDLEVIHEAISFASVAEDHHDLLLPPYPSCPSGPALPENRHLSAARKFPLSNGILKNTDYGPGGPSGPWDRLKRVLGLMGVLAKTTLTVVGVVAVVGLAGLERKRENRVVNRVVDLFRIEVAERGGEDRCPPGKVAVMEKGEIRCVVKERVEVPFDSGVGTPDVSYGCG